MSKVFAQAQLFEAPDALPAGLAYRPDFITPEEETAFRGHYQFRNAANFRSRALGPHQER